MIREKVMILVGKRRQEDLSLLERRGGSLNH
jgi:hypothetical protein